MTEADDPLTSGLDELAEGLASYRKALARAESPTKTPSQHDAESRARIAQWVVGVFLVGISVDSLFIMAGIYANRTTWVDGMHELLDILKSTLLPIVTLALGYYFGHASRSDR